MALGVRAGSPKAAHASHIQRFPLAAQGWVSKGGNRDHMR